MYLIFVLLTVCGILNLRSNYLLSPKKNLKKSRQENSNTYAHTRTHTHTHTHTQTHTHLRRPLLQNIKRHLSLQVSNQQYWKNMKERESKCYLFVIGKNMWIHCHMHSPIILDEYYADNWFSEFCPSKL